MTDVVDRATRSRMMAGIRGGDTKPELLLRKGLHANGFRYRLHVRKLPGRPDIVLPGHNAAIYVHGCFWHRHPGCRFATTPRTRTDFWRKKFRKNVDRDARNLRALQEAGWRTAVVWECSLRGDQIPNAIDVVSRWLNSVSRHIELGVNDLDQGEMFQIQQDD